MEYLRPVKPRVEQGSDDTRLLCNAHLVCDESQKRCQALPGAVVCTNVLMYTPAMLVANILCWVALFFHPIYSHLNELLDKAALER